MLHTCCMFCWKKRHCCNGWVSNRAIYACIVGKKKHRCKGWIPIAPSYNIQHSGVLCTTAVRKTLKSFFTPGTLSRPPRALLVALSRPGQTKPGATGTLPARSPAEPAPMARVARAFKHASTGSISRDRSFPWSRDPHGDGHLEKTRQAGGGFIVLYFRPFLFLFFHACMRTHMHATHPQLTALFAETQAQSKRTPSVRQQNVAAKGKASIFCAGGGGSGGGRGGRNAYPSALV